MTNPEPVISALFCFLLDVRSIKGTIIEKRIKEVVKSDSINKKKLNTNKAMYSKALMDDVKEALKVYNLFFGYAAVGTSEKTRTSFFVYSKADVT